MPANQFANRLALINEMGTLSKYQNYISTDSSITTIENDPNLFKYFVTISRASNLYIGASFTDENNNTFTILGTYNNNTPHDSAIDFVSNPTSATTYLIDVPSVVSPSSSQVWNDSRTALYPTSPYGPIFSELVNNFVQNPSQINYSFVLASLVSCQNLVLFFNKAQGRTLMTVDDGSVFIDTSKCTFNSIGIIISAGANTYQNYINKIKIEVVKNNLSSSNSYQVVENINTVTVGTAGGNYINENHNTRPEMLLALLSSSGTGFANRYSSSLGTFLSYYAVRIGNVPEENKGTIRLSVPLILTA